MTAHPKFIYSFFALIFRVCHSLYDLTLMVRLKAVFLKPGVATHLCVAEIHQGVAKNTKLVSALQLTS